MSRDYSFLPADGVPFSAYDTIFPLRIFVMIAIFVGLKRYSEMLQAHREILIASAIFSIIFVIGDSFFRFDRLAGMGGCEDSIRIWIFVCICNIYYRTVVFAIILCFLIRFFDAFSCIKLNYFDDGRLFRLCILFLILAWLPYYIWLKPGIVAFDEVTMLMHFFNIDGWGDNPTGSPPLTELLLAIPVYIGHLLKRDVLGIFICATLQFVLCIFSFAFSLRTLLYYRCSTVYEIISTVVYSIFPIFPMYALSLCKDTLFASSLLLFVTSFTYLVKSPDYFYGSQKLKFLFSISLFFSCLTRNGAFYPVVLTCLIYLTIHRNDRYKEFIKVSKKPIGCVIIFNIVVHMAGWGTSANPILPVMFQQTALYTAKYSNEQDRREIESIDNILDYNKLANSYNPELHDSVRSLWKRDASGEDIKRYVGVWVKEGVKHPLTYVEAFTHNNYLYYYPFGYSNWRKLRTNTNFDRLGDSFSINMNSELSNQISRLEELLKKTPFLGFIISCGFYSSVFILTTLLYTYKKISLLTMSPLLVIYVSCLFLPVNGNFRYFLSIIFCVPYCFALAYSKARDQESR